MNKYIINGKFLSQSVTGVQRYARELIKELDELVGEDHELELVIPSNCLDILPLRNIKVKKIGKFTTGIIWEQITLPLYALRKKVICLNLCNSMPILSKNITVLHDISFKVNPQFYSQKARIWTNFMVSACIKRLKAILTVSNFSKSEIARVYKINESKISVIYNAWQHFKRCDYDESSLDRYDLKKGTYYFSMSSLTKNKNFRWIAENAQNNPNVTYAISGAMNNRIFSDTFDFDIPSNMKFLGYVSDEEAKTLMRHCKAFLFPTFYEGFGIPPLEAMSVGAKIVVSDTSCMREIYENAAYYIDPYNPNINLDQLLDLEVIPALEILNKFSWKESAYKLYEILYNFKEEEI